MRWASAVSWSVLNILLLRCLHICYRFNAWLRRSWGESYKAEQGTCNHTKWSSWLSKGRLLFFCYHFSSHFVMSRCKISRHRLMGLRQLWSGKVILQITVFRIMAMLRILGAKEVVQKSNFSQVLSGIKLGRHMVSHLLGQEDASLLAFPPLTIQYRGVSISLPHWSGQGDLTP